MDLLQPTIQYLEKLNVNYIFYGPALSGLVKNNNIEKYNNNYCLLIYKQNLIKMAILFMFLLFRGIILKIKLKLKYNDKAPFLFLMYKIVGKPTLFSKTGHHIEIKILKTENQQHKIWDGERYVFFEPEDLKKTEIINYNNIKILVPKNPSKFVDKYIKNIFSSFDKNHSVKLKNEKVEEARELLSGVANTLEKQKIKYFLDAGTLLGAVRDKEFIPWDHDIDLGLIYRNQEEIEGLIKQLKKEFYVRSLKFKNSPGIWNLGKYRIIKVYKNRSLSAENQLCLDIFLFYKSRLDSTQEEVYKYGVFDQNAFYPSNLLKEFKEIKFYDRKYSVPKKSESFLEFKYGANWQTPQKKWITMLNDTSLIKNNLDKKSNK